MPLSRLGQFALPVSDADRGERFYGEVLGLKKLFRFGSLVFFDCQGVRLMIEGSSKAVVPSQGVCHYFAVSQIEDEVRELKAKGVTFEDEPHLIAKMPDHDLWMTFFKDPDGHLLALMEERKQSQ
ncbi:MAG: VOC family protein [Spirochaetia bacterium]|nr:VOC family protein [Spirochaetia bacterium]